MKYWCPVATNMNVIRRRNRPPKGPLPFGVFPGYSHSRSPRFEDFHGHDVGLPMRLSGMPPGMMMGRGGGRRSIPFEEDYLFGDRYMREPFE